MSQTLKEKMYEYETIPPQGVWESIANALDNENTDELEPPALTEKKTNKFKYFTMAAAAAVIVAVCFLVFRKSSVITSNELASNDSSTNNININPAERKILSLRKKHDAILRVPEGDDSLQNNDELLLAKNTTTTDIGPAEKAADENNRADDKTKGSDSKKQDVKSSSSHTYITIAGPQGQPIKVSSKIASILSPSEEKSTSTIKWNKKLIEWKIAMQSNTVAATPGNFLDIVELTNTLTDN